MARRAVAMGALAASLASAQLCSDTCPPAQSVGSDLCPGDNALPSFPAILTPCYPSGAESPDLNELYPHQAPSGPAHLIVIANHYVGCNAGRREANIYAYVATTMHHAHPNIHFLSSLKGGTASSCASWSANYASSWVGTYGNAAAGLDEAEEQPTYIYDSDYQLRDAYFTAPFGHPSYAIIDHLGVLREKFTGPCCGEASYHDCSADQALELNATLHAKLAPLLQEVQLLYPNGSSDCLLSAWSAWGECDCSGGGEYGPPRTQHRTVLQEGFGPSGLKCSSFETERREGEGVEEGSGCVCADPEPCEYGPWGEWGNCTATCGHTGRRFRERTVVQEAKFNGSACQSSALVEAKACGALKPCAQQCVPRLGLSLAAAPVATSSEGLASPRGLAFSPQPGLHLGNFTDEMGRSFPGPPKGDGFDDGFDEAWVTNGHSHSITIVTGLSSSSPSTSSSGNADAASHVRNGTLGVGEALALSRRDRGWVHYLANVTGISFNSVKGSGRDGGKDTFGYFATCQADANTYQGSKRPNYFMGPSLYDPRPPGQDLSSKGQEPGESSVVRGNVVGSSGEPCVSGEECWFAHSDMLHEAPDCPGLVHDPETATSYGSVFWAVDATVGQLVRFDFQQPHGPGSMDHSAAAVRRYPEVNLTTSKDAKGLHRGMAIDPANRVLYLSDPKPPGKTSGGAGSGLKGGRVVWVNLDSGEVARSARQEYPLFSSRLPSFEYSVVECVSFGTFAADLDGPSGLALAPPTFAKSASSSGSSSLESPTSLLLFVAEHGTGDLVVFDTATGAQVKRYATPLGVGPGLSGLAFAPHSGLLYATHARTNTLFTLQSAAAAEAAEEGGEEEEEEEEGDNAACPAEAYAPYLSEVVSVPLGYAATSVGPALAAEQSSSVSNAAGKKSECAVDGTIPNSTFYDQVHNDGTGYSGVAADLNGSLADAASMGGTAGNELANRTDCGRDQGLNFDALLLGGYFCHACLPDNCQPPPHSGGGVGVGGREGHCRNVRWEGFTCDNEVALDYHRPDGGGGAGGVAEGGATGYYKVYSAATGVPRGLSPVDGGEQATAPLLLTPGRAYRFVVRRGNTATHKQQQQQQQPMAFVSAADGTPLSPAVATGVLVYAVPSTEALLALDASGLRASHWPAALAHFAQEVEGANASSSSSSSSSGGGGAASSVAFDVPLVLDGDSLLPSSDEPTVSPTPTPAVAPTPAPLKGMCFSGDSTVQVRRSKRGDVSGDVSSDVSSGDGGVDGDVPLRRTTATTKTVPLSDVRQGDFILAVGAPGEGGREHFSFARVTRLGWSESTQPWVEITVSGAEDRGISEASRARAPPPHRALRTDPVGPAVDPAEAGADTAAAVAAAAAAPVGGGVEAKQEQPLRLRVTPHHGFPTCSFPPSSSNRHGAVHVKNKLVPAHALKTGSCLHTVQGKRTVLGVKTAQPEVGDWTATVELEGGVDLAVVGGVVTHVRPSERADDGPKDEERLANSKRHSEVSVSPTRIVPPRRWNRLVRWLQSKSAQAKGRENQE